MDQAQSGGCSSGGDLGPVNPKCLIDQDTVQVATLAQNRDGQTTACGVFPARQQFIQNCITLFIDLYM